MKKLVQFLALSSLLGAGGPRNAPRMFGRATGPYESRMVRSSYVTPAQEAATVYPVGNISKRKIQEYYGELPPVIMSKISKFNRKLTGGYIPENILSAKPVYVTMGKAGPIQIGMKPGLAPEQVRVLLSRGYRIQNNSSRKKALTGALINPNTSVNRQSQRFWAQASGTGVNAFPVALRGKVRKAIKENPEMSLFQPVGRPALPNK